MGSRTRECLESSVRSHGQSILHPVRISLTREGRRMTLDIAAVLSCPGNPVDASHASPWGGGGVGIHSHRYKRDGEGGTGTRLAGEQTGQETSVAAGSHTHTSSNRVCCLFCGCCVSGCTRHAPSTATKARGTVWVIIWGTDVCLTCVCVRVLSFGGCCVSGRVTGLVP